MGDLNVYRTLRPIHLNICRRDVGELWSQIVNHLPNVFNIHNDTILNIQ